MELEHGPFHWCDFHELASSIRCQETSFNYIAYTSSTIQPVEPNNVLSNRTTEALICFMNAGEALKTALIKTEATLVGLADNYADDPAGVTFLNHIIRKYRKYYGCYPSHIVETYDRDLYIININDIELFVSERRQFGGFIRGHKALKIKDAYKHVDWEVNV